ncbi:MAG: hypothetical protein ABI781_02100, partial [Burkholderiales bacterium]
MDIRAARLYRKNTGVYFIRVLLSPSHSRSTSDSLKSPNKSESKRSLRTKNPQLARTLSTHLNALLAGAPRHQREGIVDHFFEHTISSWTVAGVTCEGDDDQNRFEGLLKRFPRLEEAVATHIAGAATAKPVFAAHEPRPALPMPSPAPSAISDGEFEGLLARALHNRQAPTSVAAPQAAARRAVPDPFPGMNVSFGRAPVARNPMRFSEALVEYKARMLRGEENTERTVSDKCTLLTNLRTHLGENYPELGSDQWLHEIETHHVSSF